MLVEIVNNTLNFLWQLTCGIMVFIGIFAFAGMVNYKRIKNRVVLVDFDSLVNIEPIINRSKIWIANGNGTGDEYFAAHITEQEVIPNQILKCLSWQNMGYKLVYISNRKEELRIPTAKVLNDWKLRGELYCAGSPYEKEMIFVEIRKNAKVKGLICEVNENNRKFANVMLQTEVL